MRVPVFLAVASAALVILFMAAFIIAALLEFVPPVTTLSGAIVEITVGTIFLYIASKAFQLLSKRRLGYHEDEATPVQRTRVGEPLLVGVLLTLTTLIVTYSSWWNHRLASREYAHSKLCYAQLETADRVPRLNAQFPPDLENLAKISLSVAEEHGAKLGMHKDAMDQDLRQAADAYWRSYVRLTPSAAERNGRVLMGDVIRCVDDRWAPHGELLNP